MLSNNKKIILLGISIFFLVSISSVCGSPVDDMTSNSGANAGVNEFDGNVLTENLDGGGDGDDQISNDALDVDGDSASDVSFDVSEEGEIHEVASFEDLERDISNLKPGDVYNIDRDYCFFLNDSNPHEGIAINVDNITINGNGHVIDGNNQTAFFTINSNNVKIFNLTFVNGQYHGETRSCMITFLFMGFYCYNYTDDLSPITWCGNNGLISDCVFSGNTAINGGVIRWYGNNGLIENLTFNNNTARGVAGAIYLIGNGNVIRNSSFVNSFSNLTGESIFIDQNSTDYNISGLFNTNRPIIRGSETGIDPEFLLYSYGSLVSDIYVDLVPILYSSIVSNNTIYYSNDLYFFPQYNETDYILSFGRIVDNSTFIYGKNYCFSNFSCWNDLFQLLVYGDFRNEVIFSYTAKVFDKEAYEKAINTKVDIFDKYIEMYCIQKDLNQMSSYAVSKLFYVDIFGNYYDPIDSKKTWKPSDSGFDAIIIDGHGSRIKVSSGKRDENKFACVEKNNTVFMVSNLVIEGFNCAIENLGGTCFLENLTITGNMMDYITDPDYGAGVRNAGTCVCTNCTFSNNYCKYGAAIFSQGLLVVNNCTFKNNTAYGKGDDICNNDAVVILDGVEINGTEGIVEHVEGLDMGTVAILSFAAVMFTVVITSVLTAVSLNPFAGLAVGACIGFAVGSITSAIICSNIYDFTYNKLLTAIIVIAVCTAVGAGLGYVYSNPVAYQSNMVYYIQADSESTLSSLDSSSVISSLSD